VLRLRFADFTRATRSRTLPQATAETHAILAAARELLAIAMPMIEREGITLVGIAVSNLENDDAVQLALPFDRWSGVAFDHASTRGTRRRPRFSRRSKASVRRTLRGSGGSRRRAS